ncbi:MAG: hypothetical protein R2697_01550 [Ilumatobacteraceae bacterium]
MSCTPTRTPTTRPPRSGSRTSAAYDVLGDETKRKEYDEVRRLGPMGGYGGGAPGGGPGGFTFNVGDMGGGDIGDLLGQMFGQARRRRSRRAAGPQRGADLTAHLTLDFDDAAGPDDDALPDERRPVLHLRRFRAKPGTHPVAVCAAAAVSSTTTRVCSRSRRRVATAKDAARSSPNRARPVTVPVSSGDPARSRFASSPACPTVRRSG